MVFSELKSHKLTLPPSCGRVLCGLKKKKACITSLKLTSSHPTWFCWTFLWFWQNSTVITLCITWHHKQSRAPHPYTSFQISSFVPTAASTGHSFCLPFQIVELYNPVCNFIPYECCFSQDSRRGARPSSQPEAFPAMHIGLFLLLFLLFHTPNLNSFYQPSQTDNATT